jgi:hypothetical protein
MPTLRRVWRAWLRLEFTNTDAGDVMLIASTNGVTGISRFDNFLFESIPAPATAGIALGSLIPLVWPTPAAALMCFGLANGEQNSKNQRRKEVEGEAPGKSGTCSFESLSVGFQSPLFRLAEGPSSMDVQNGVV